MFNPLREKLADCLVRQQVCVLSTNGKGEPGSGESGSRGVWATPVRYRSHGLEVDCLIPRWADAAYYLEQDPHLLLIIYIAEGKGLRWLQYRGNVQPLVTPNWAELLPEDPANGRPEECYLAIHVLPSRIDLIDESQGWGVLESLEF